MMRSSCRVPEGWPDSAAGAEAGRLRSRSESAPVRLRTAILICLVFAPLSGRGMAASRQDPVSLVFTLLAEALHFVDRQGMVNYTALKRDRRSLDRFSESLSSFSRQDYDSLQTNEQIAFWVNAYNGLTLLAITDHYPIQSSFLTSLVYPRNSIRQISGVWDELTFPVMGSEMTLDRIEHQILRRDFDEPRIHLALVCAAVSCPPLRSEPYLGSRLDDQLQDQARPSLPIRPSSVSSGQAEGYTCPRSSTGSDPISFPGTGPTAGFQRFRPRNGRF